MRPETTLWKSSVIGLGGPPCGLIDPMFACRLGTRLGVGWELTGDCLFSLLESGPRFHVEVVTDDPVRADYTGVPWLAPGSQQRQVDRTWDGTWGWLVNPVPILPGCCESGHLNCNGHTGAGRS